MGVVNLKKYKQYKQFHENRQLDLTQDTVYIHNKKHNIQREYSAAWIKLLTENIRGEIKNV